MTNSQWGLVIFCCGVLSPALSKACPEPRRRAEGLSQGRPNLPCRHYVVQDETMHHLLHWRFVVGKDYG